MKYYKVIDRLSSDIIIDTDELNYGLTLKKTPQYSTFLNFITQSSNSLDLPLDFYFLINNNLSLLGNLYFKNFPKPNRGVFELFNITKDSNHKKYFIKEADLISIIETLDKIGICFFDEGFYLWENIFESVRHNKYNDKPNRRKSFFLFSNITDCNHYIENHKKNGIICEVEIIETNSLFKADMNLLDEIPNYFTFKQTENKANDYWGGKISESPVFEFLFQGKCKLRPL